MIAIFHLDGANAVRPCTGQMYRMGLMARCFKMVSNKMANSNTTKALKPACGAETTLGRDKHHMVGVGGALSACDYISRVISPGVATNPELELTVTWNSLWSDDHQSDAALLVSAQALRIGRAATP